MSSTDPRPYFDLAFPVGEVIDTCSDCDEPVQFVGTDDGLAPLVAWAARRQALRRHAA